MGIIEMQHENGQREIQRGKLRILVDCHLTTDSQPGSFIKVNLN